MYTLVTVASPMKSVLINCYGDDEMYFDALSLAWEHGETFVNIEQDIDASPLAIRSLVECERDWCACPYPYLDRERQFGLGCAKFSEALMARHPEMFSEIAGWKDDTHPAKHWCTLDAWTYLYLTGHGEERCEAHPLVGHLGHPGKKASAHGCFQVP